MLSGSTRVAKQSPLLTPGGLSSSVGFRNPRTSSSASVPRCRPRTRTSTAIEASFLDAVFSGGSKTSPASVEKAEELSSQLAGLLKGRGGRLLMGPNEEIDAIVSNLEKLKVAKSPTKSPSFYGEYKPAYVSVDINLPDGENFKFFISQEPGKSFRRYEKKDYGLFPLESKLVGDVQVGGPNTFSFIISTGFRDEGIFERAAEQEISGKSNSTILYADDRYLIIRTVARQLRKPYVEILERSGIQAAPKKPVTKTGTAEVGGPASKAATKKLERVYQSPASDGTTRKRGTQAIDKKDTKDKARLEKEKQVKAEAVRQQKVKEAAEKQEALRMQKEKEAAAKAAREEEIRRQKEKAEAERAAQATLKAEIQASVDGFNQRLKDAQEQKKAAVAALRTFERDNSGVLKELVAYKKEMDGLEGEIDALLIETQNTIEDGKAATTEIKDCRREVVDLERKLAKI